MKGFEIFTETNFMKERFMDSIFFVKVNYEIHREKNISEKIRIPEKKKIEKLPLPSDHFSFQKQLSISKILSTFLKGQNCY